MTEDEEVFGLDDELPPWLEDDADDILEELDGLDDDGLLEEPAP